jgi:uncharacterized membrane protein
MPYCTSCGYQVEPQAAFCRNCGAPQLRTTTAIPHDFLNGVSDRMACMFCYIPVIGIIPAVVCLAAQKFRHNYRVRFNAFQGLYMFVAWLILSSAFPSIFADSWDNAPERAVFGLLRVALIFCWIYMMVKAYHGQDVRLPIVGDLAARSTHEQL